MRCLCFQQPNSTQRANVQNVNFWQKQTTDQQAKPRASASPAELRAARSERSVRSSRVKWVWPEQATKQTGFWIVCMFMFSWGSCFVSAQAQLECNPMIWWRWRPLTQYIFLKWGSNQMSGTLHLVCFRHSDRDRDICNKDANYKLMV